MKLLLCIMALMSISAYGMRMNYDYFNIIESDYWANRLSRTWDTFPIVGAAPQIFKLPNFPAAVPQPSPAVSDPTFQPRLDALAERVAAMEAQIKSLK